MFFCFFMPLSFFVIFWGYKFGIQLLLAPPCAPDAWKCPSDSFLFFSFLGVFSLGDLLRFEAFSGERFLQNSILWGVLCPNCIPWRVLCPDSILWGVLCPEGIHTLGSAVPRQHTLGSALPKRHTLGGVVPEQHTLGNDVPNWVVNAWLMRG